MKKLVLLCLIVVLLTSIILILSGSIHLFQKENPQTSSQKTSEIIEDGHIILAAGDIAQCDGEGTNATGTAKLLDKLPGTILTLGDNVYPIGKKEEYDLCFEPTWGRHKKRIYPSIGNHEYLYFKKDASPYYEYFGERAGEVGKGYYSFNLGNWHLVALNMETIMREYYCPKNPNAINCGGGGLEQIEWLEEDLQQNKTDCTLVYGHYPGFSSGVNDNIRIWISLWELLYKYDIDVFLAGHSHIYERFASQTPEGKLDRKRGIRQFTVGTGGAQIGGVVSPPIENSEVLRNDTYGILKMNLGKGEYEWEFIATNGKFVDKGKSNCH